MSAAMAAIDDEQATRVAKKLIEFLESGVAPAGLFAPDVFCDYSPPLWRVQAQGPADVAALRMNGYTGRSEVVSWRCDPTTKGFVLEVEERWIADEKRWYCREMIRADVADGAITALSVYCTGDWSAERCAQHARDVRLLRP